MSNTEGFGLRHFLRVPSWPLWLRVAQIEALPIFRTLVVDQLSVCRQFATWPVSDIKSVFAGRRSEQNAIRRSYVEVPSQYGLAPARRHPLRRQAAQASTS